MTTKPDEQLYLLPAPDSRCREVLCNRPMLLKSLFNISEIAASLRGCRHWLLLACTLHMRHMLIRVSLHQF